MSQEFEGYRDARALMAARSMAARGYKPVPCLLCRWPAHFPKPEEAKCEDCLTIFYGLEEFLLRGGEAARNFVWAELVKGSAQCCGKEEGPRLTYCKEHGWIPLR